MEKRKLKGLLAMLALAAAAALAEGERASEDGAALELKLYSAPWTVSASGEKPEKMGAWEVLPGAHDKGAAPLASLSLAEGEKGRLRAAAHVRDRNWYHAYCLEKELIPVTVAFDTVSLEFEAVLQDSGASRTLRLTPVMEYESGAYADVARAEALTLELPFEGASGCAALRSADPLPGRMLRDAGHREAGAWLLCWSETK